MTAHILIIELGFSWYLLYEENDSCDGKYTLNFQIILRYRRSLTLTCFNPGSIIQETPNIHSSVLLLPNYFSHN